MSMLLSFLLGILASLLATFIVFTLKKIHNRRIIPSLEGYWLEFIPMSKDRQYSIGRFRYNKSNNSYNFDGKNYMNDGTIFCTWESTNVHIDQTNRRIDYIFKASIKNQLHEENYGFGVIHTVDKSGSPIPIKGHYIEAKKDAVPYTHNMIKLDDVIDKLGIDTKNKSIEFLHSEIVFQCSKRNLKSL